jgi:hypothetical protein
VTVVAIVLLRVHALWFKYRISASAFADTIVAAVDQGNFANAIQLSAQRQGSTVFCCANCARHAGVEGLTDSV